MKSFHQAGAAKNSPKPASPSTHIPVTHIPSTYSKTKSSNPPKRKISRPALRLISTNGLSHDSWLNVRKQGIGSSDAAAAVGLNPYQSMLEL